MITGSFREFRGGSHLETIFGINIRNFLIFVEILCPLAEVLLHHIQKFVVLGLVHPGILDHQAPIFSQCFCHLLAVALGGGALGEKTLHIYNRNLYRCTTKYNPLRNCLKHFV